MSPLEIVLRAIGADNVTAALGRVADRAQEMGGDVQGAAREAAAAARGLDDVARSADDAGRSIQGAGREINNATQGVDRGAGRARDALQEVGSEAGQLSGELRDVGNNNGLDEATRDADRLGESLDESSNRVSGLVSNLEKVRNAGMGMTAVGLGGIALSHSLADGATSAQGDADKMRAMLEKTNQGGRFDEMDKFASKIAWDAGLDDDDQIRRVTAGLLGFGMTADHIKQIMPGLIGQSRLYDQSLESMAMTIGKAYGKGDAGALTDIGVTLGDADKKRLADVKDSSEDVRKAEMMRALLASFNDYALGLTEGLGAAELQANRTALALGDIQDAFGQGAAEAETSVNSIVGNILKLASASEDVQKSAGYWLTYGSYALAAGGTVLTVGSQAALTAASLKTLGFTGAGAMTMIQTAAAAAGGTVLALAAAALFAVVAIAAAIYSWNVNKDKILNPTSSTDDTRSGDEVRDDAAKKRALDRTREAAKGMSARDRYVVNRRLTQGYLDLGETEAASAARQDADRLRKQLPQNFKTPSSDAARDLIEGLKGQNFATNKSKRLDGKAFAEFQKANAQKRKQEELQNTAGGLQKQLDQMKAGFAQPAAASLPNAGADYSGLSLDELQMRAAERARDGAKDQAAGNLKYEIFLKKRAERLQKEHERESQTEERARKKQIDERQKQLAKTAKQTGKTGNSDKASPALAQLATRPPREFLGANLTGFDVSDERPDLTGGADLSPLDLLNFVRNGGSLFNVPGVTGRERARDESGGASGAAPSGRQRTGALDLRETGRKSSGGVERVTVTGTLDLEEDGTLSGAALGFRL